MCNILLLSTSNPSILLDELEVLLGVYRLLLIEKIIQTGMTLDIQSQILKANVQRPRRIYPGIGIQPLSIIRITRVGDGHLPINIRHWRGAGAGN